jgi:hypothetical protein
VLPNDALARVTQRNLEEVGGFHLYNGRKAFAEELQRSLRAGGAGELAMSYNYHPVIPASQKPPLNYRNK